MCESARRMSLRIASTCRSGMVAASLAPFNTSVVAKLLNEDIKEIGILSNVADLDGIQSDSVLPILD